MRSRGGASGFDDPVGGQFQTFLGAFVVYAYSCVGVQCGDPLDPYSGIPIYQGSMTGRRIKPSWCRGIEEPLLETESNERRSQP